MSRHETLVRSGEDPEISPENKPREAPQATPDVLAGSSTDALAGTVPGGTSSPVKRGNLHGGALTAEVLASSRTILSPVRGNKNAFVGLQQYFSPPQAAELLAAVFGNQGAVLDPTAGSGALLSGFVEDARFGIEIDSDQVREGSYEPITGDVQAVVPMLRAAGLQFPAVALNPPFGLSWHDALHAGGGAKGEINSTVLSFLWALDLLHPNGQGAMICGTDRLSGRLQGREEASGIYAVVDIVGPLFENVALPTSIAFFVQPANTLPTSYRTEGPLRLRSTREDLASLAPQIMEARERRAGFVTSYWSSERLLRLRQGFRAVAGEYERRNGDSLQDTLDRAFRYDIGLKGNKVKVSLSPYAQLALAKTGELTNIQSLSGHHVSYFGQNTRAWKQIQQALDQGNLTVDPALAHRADEALRDAALVSTPLFPVPPQMRLGWLTDLDRIPCKKDDPERGYEAGRKYPLSTRSKVASETEERVVEKKNGEPELRRFVTERRLLEVRIEDHVFDESNENTAYLAEHFELPDPGCVATRFPERMRDNRNLLGHIARKNSFRLKPFQLDHLSRLLIKGRGMLAHEPGLGKTLQQMCLVEAQAWLGAEPQALFISPQDLVPQTNRECKKFFGRRLEHIQGPAHARDVADRVRAGEPGWWITHFEVLSIVGRKKELLPTTYLDPKVALEKRLYDYKVQKRLKAGKETGSVERPEAGATSRVACPECRAGTSAGWNGEACRKCGYVHRSVYRKPAYSHLTTAFERGVVCVDEVSEIRGDSLRSKAVRALGRGPHRYGATGTPLSNYISDAYFGLEFCLGAGSTAFPYTPGNPGRAKFESDFCVVEFLHGREEDGEGHLRKRRKVLPQITNVSQFWRLAQPGVSRCRKEHTGEPLAERTFYPVRVPMGVAQQKAHAFWLENFPDYFEWRYPKHPLVEAGLHEKFAAGLGQRWRMEFAATLPAADAPTFEWPEALEEIGEPSNFTPANLKVLELAMHHVRRGEKVLVGSDLVGTGPWISARLAEKGVRAVHITQEKSGKVATKSPRERAAAVADFTEGDTQVLCSGTAALKLGHNLTAVSTVILSGMPDSWTIFTQFLDRVHRLTSPNPVSVYIIMTRHSLAEEKWNQLRHKGATSDLAFDGELSVQPEKPIDWSKVLKEMRERGIGLNESGDEVPEADIEAAWNALAPLAFLTPARGPSGLPKAQPELPLVEPPLARAIAGAGSLFSLFDDEPRRYVQSSLF